MQGDSTSVGQLKEQDDFPGDILQLTGKVSKKIFANASKNSPNFSSVMISNILYTSVHIGQWKELC